MQTVAYYAALDNTHGVALRTADGSVHFQAASTGLWTALVDTDAPRLHLHGRVDLADAQALADGNPVRKASRTLQKGA